MRAAKLRRLYTDSLLGDQSKVQALVSGTMMNVAFIHFCARCSLLSSISPNPRCERVFK